MNLAELSPVPLEAVIITAELDRRPGRVPDLEADSQVLRELMKALKDPDVSLFQQIAEAALRLCRAHSAGVTVEEEEQGRTIMRCHGAAGGWSPLARRGVPRELCPTSSALDRRMPLLLTYPERHFTGLLGVPVTPTAEMLIVPLTVADAAVGTIYVVAHDDARRFDREDVRLLMNLSEYASVLYQSLQRRLQLQDALARERLGSQLLQAISAGLMSEADPNALYKQILDAATAIMRADFASMHTAKASELYPMEWKGFPKETAWPSIRWDSPTSCAMAARTGERFVIVDTEQCELFAGRAAALEALRRSGIRAMQSTPLISRSGELVGVLTTHWRVPYEPTADELRLLDVLARLAADLMERARTIQALREMDQRKTEFLAMLSHELRNPLAPISTGLELLGRSEDKPELIRSLHSMMSRQVSHLTRLVNDLLDLSRITRGTIELEYALLDLRVVIEAAIELSKPLMDQRRHALALQDVDSSLVVDGDMERLTQVISNVLSNAARYTEPGGQIHLSLVAEAGHAVVRVRDSGLGIPAGKLEEVFEMFVQVPEHRAHSGGSGLGIGLALSRRIIELHGGSIWARSEGLGHGSEFFIRLPLAASQAVAEEIGSERIPAPGPSRHVLIIEDNVDAAHMLRVALESFGHAVRVAHDGPSGLAEFETLAAEVVLLDIGLPGMDGYNVARQLRESPRGREVLLIAVTGWGQENDRERSRHAGFDAHLTKPVRLEELRAVMATERSE
jgi:signal transduction histidine kinase/ActR/RegA family two-component response regulator